MNIDFIKEQFEIAKIASHLSETIVIDIGTMEWLIEQSEKVEKLKEHHMEVKGFIDKNMELNKIIELRGRKIIKLQNELIEQSKFYEELLKE